MFLMEVNEAKELRVAPIKNGTVIDHITAGQAFNVMKILGLSSDVPNTVTALLRAPSQKQKFKDVVKIEDRELTSLEINKIAVIAPEAVYNIVRDYAVAEKHAVKAPDTLIDILRCGNPNCITISGTKWSKEALEGKPWQPKEPVSYKMKRFIDKEQPNKYIYECHYCERRIEDNLMEYLL